MNPWYRVILPFNFEWIPINLMAGKLLWEILQLTRLLGYAQFKLRFLMVFWRILIDVQYIPLLKKNWFLLILFILKRCIYQGRSGLGRILKGAPFIMRGQKVNNPPSYTKGRVNKIPITCWMMCVVLVHLWLNHHWNIYVCLHQLLTSYKISSKCVFDAGQLLDCRSRLMGGLQAKQVVK